MTGSKWIHRQDFDPAFIYFCWMFLGVFFFFSKPIREGLEGYQRPRGSSYLGQYNWGRDLCVPVPALDIGDLKFYYFNLLDLHVCYWCWIVVGQISLNMFVRMRMINDDWHFFRILILKPPYLFTSARKASYFIHGKTCKNQQKGLDHLPLKKLPGGAPYLAKLVYNQ